MRKINSIIVHCSDSWWGDAEVIDKWHKERGFIGIGYHYVILNGFPTSDDWRNNAFNPGCDGEIQLGRTLDEVGAHCQGHNQASVGICLIGKTHFTDRQLAGLRTLVAGLRERLGDLALRGHRELNPGKTCPNFDPGLLRDICRPGCGRAGA